MKAGMTDIKYQTKLKTENDCHAFQRHKSHKSYHNSIIQRYD